MLAPTLDAGWCCRNPLGWAPAPLAQCLSDPYLGPRPRMHGPMLVIAWPGPVSNRAPTAERQGWRSEAQTSSMGELALNRVAVPTPPNVLCPGGASDY